VILLKSKDLKPVLPSKIWMLIKHTQLGFRGSHWLSKLFGRLKSRGPWFEASLGKYFARLYFHNNQSKMNWRCGSSSRAPALQPGSPEP
jgi:hypothetical protein